MWAWIKSAILLKKELLLLNLQSFCFYFYASRRGGGGGKAFCNKEPVMSIAMDEGAEVEQGIK